MNCRDLFVVEDGDFGAAIDLTSLPRRGDRILAVMSCRQFGDGHWDVDTLQDGVDPKDEHRSHCVRLYRDGVDITLAILREILVDGPTWGRARIELHWLSSDEDAVIRVQTDTLED